MVEPRRCPRVQGCFTSSRRNVLFVWLPGSTAICADTNGGVPVSTENPEGTTGLIVVLFLRHHDQSESTADHDTFKHELSVCVAWLNFVEKRKPVPDFRRQSVRAAKNVNSHFVDKLRYVAKEMIVCGVLRRSCRMLGECRLPTCKVHHMPETKLQTWLRAAFSNPHLYMPLGQPASTTPPIRKVTLIRHAESEENVRVEARRNRLVHGETCEMPLIEALKECRHSMRNCHIISWR